MPYTVLISAATTTLLPLALLLLLDDQDGASPLYPDPPEGPPPVLEIEGAAAKAAGEMKRYTERVPGSEVTFEMIPIAGGSFRMGSPEGEAERKDSEGPVHEVEVDPFWMEIHETTWDEYGVFMHRLDLQARSRGETQAVVQDPWADAVSRPTPPYMPMDFSMGTSGYPAICMTQFAAKQYTKWLSMKTGRFYRLPTEAEWEYACRAGTKTAYSWGDDPDDGEEYAWWFDNADDTYQQVMKKKANPWGLFDMHGNVAEWTLDAWVEDAYDRKVEGVVQNPVVWPVTLFPRVVRGGTWDDDIEELRSAARRRSSPGWQAQDPQLPKSIWYHTDAKFVGFRVVRPLVVPPKEEWAKYWEADLDAIREIQEKQRKGER